MQVSQITRKQKNQLEVARALYARLKNHSIQVQSNLIFLDFVDLTCEQIVVFYANEL